MATYDASLNAGGRGFTLRLQIDIAYQDINANATVVNWSLTLIRGASSFSSSTKYWAVDLSGAAQASGSFAGYNFSSYASLVVGSGAFALYHAADGTYSQPVSGSFNDAGSPTFGSGTASGTLTLPTIPRATQPTVSPASGDTGTAFTIGAVAASGSFRHDIFYSLTGGDPYTQIGTDLPGGMTWTPPSTLFPNTTGGTARIAVNTKTGVGGTYIGQRTVDIPLTVPATVKPTVSSVAWVDTQTSAPDVPTLMGGAGRFVQGWSRLQPTATAAGASGSTVTGTAITQSGQTTPSGVAFGLPVSLSGAVPFSAVATDSRGRTSDPLTGTVAVTAYNFPSLPVPLVARTSDAAGTIPSPTGTYLAITPAASVSSLVFASVQKNLLEWRIRIKPVGGSFTTVQDWTAATVSGNTWTTKYVTGGSYLSSNEYVVEVSIRDLFGKNGFSTASTIVTQSVPVASESVFADWNGADKMGLFKYHANGNLDVGGSLGIYQGGLPVVDFGDVASTSTPGLVQLPTAAEAAAGTGVKVSTMAQTASDRTDMCRNGRFRVNQRGAASGTSLALDALFLDGWRSGTATNAVTWTGSDTAGRTLTIPASKTIYQVVEDIDIVGGDYTLIVVGTAQGQIVQGAVDSGMGASPRTATFAAGVKVTVRLGPGTVSRVMLVRGSIPALDISYADDLRRCQRYFQRKGPTGFTDSVFAQGLVMNTTTATYGNIPLAVPMRALPAISFASLASSDRFSGNGAISAFAANYGYSPGSTELTVMVTHAAVGAAGRGAQIVTSSTTASFLELNAETT